MKATQQLRFNDLRKQAIDEFHRPKMKSKQTWDDSEIEVIYSSKALWTIIIGNQI